MAFRPLPTGSYGGELYFANQAAMGQGASSPEGQAAVKHAADIASGGLDAMVVEVEE